MKDPQGSASTLARLLIKDRFRLKTPCDDCTACCKGMYVQIEQGDDPSLFDDNGILPTEDGHCAYLVDNKCSIYDKRPKVCRAFDCRLFALSGLAHEEKEVTEAIAQWDEQKFIRSTDDVETIRAIRRAVHWVRERPLAIKIIENGSTRPARQEDVSAQLITERAIQIHKNFMNGAKK